MDSKSYEDGLKAAFAARVETAAHSSYDGVESIPKDWLEVKYRAFRDGLAGHPWTPAHWEAQSQELERRRQALNKPPIMGYMVRSEKQERIHRDSSSPGHDCDY